MQFIFSKLLLHNISSSVSELKSFIWLLVECRTHGDDMIDNTTKFKKKNGESSFFSKGPYRVRLFCMFDADLT